MVLYLWKGLWRKPPASEIESTRAAMYPDHERISLGINSRTGRPLYVTVHSWGFPTDTLVSGLAAGELEVVPEFTDTHMTKEGNEGCIKQLLNLLKD